MCVCIYLGVLYSIYYIMITCNTTNSTCLTAISIVVYYQLYLSADIPYILYDNNSFIITSVTYTRVLYTACNYE